MVMTTANLAGNDAAERACFADIFTYIPAGVSAFCAPIAGRARV